MTTESLNNFLEMYDRHWHKEQIQQKVERDSGLWIALMRTRCSECLIKLRYYGRL